MVAAQTILPTLTISGVALWFEYERSTAASATIQVVEYGGDLSAWTPVTIPEVSSGTVTITPGSISDHVKVTIPNQANQLFIRLKVSQ